jgi:DNA-binding protein HU-beta
MNKTQLIEELSSKTGLTKSKASDIVGVLLDSITKSLVSDDNVVLVGFGTWAVKKRPARKGRNPQNGAVIQIPATKVVSFRMSKKLKDEMKQGKGGTGSHHATKKK